jgi:tetratricopeptide (TPR) repeat protein
MMNVSPEHLIQQARERFALQDYRSAALLLEEVVAGGRAFADVHHLLGVSYSLLGQPERALKDFDRAIELNPRYLEALIHRGMILMDLGRREEADTSFQQAQLGDGLTAGFPAHAAGRLANLHAAVAEAYAELGALEPAIEQLRLATRLGPKFPDLRYRLARLQLEAGQTLEAREELELVVRNRPNFLDALALLGLARYLSGDASGAEQVWRDCLSRRPEDARVEAYLAMLSRGAR